MSLHYRRGQYCTPVSALFFLQWTNDEVAAAVATLFTLFGVYLCPRLALFLQVSISESLNLKRKNIFNY